jgi:hypothetical protein
VDPHREQSEQHQRDGEGADADPHPRHHQAGGADQHDQDLAQFDDADDPGLVAGVGELARQRREQKEGEDEDPGRHRAEPGLRPFVIVDLVDDEQHHRVLEQVVVERIEQLGREQGQEAAHPEQMKGVGHRAKQSPASRPQARRGERALGILILLARRPGAES